MSDEKKLYCKLFDYFENFMARDDLGYMKFCMVTYSVSIVTLSRKLVIRMVRCLEVKK